MAEDQWEPDWLDELSEPGQEEEPESQTDQTDMLEGLREQMVQQEEEIEPRKKAGLVSAVLNLRPWQRFVLVVLLFLDVAICGCMALVMLGRVMLPF